MAATKDGRLHGLETTEIHFSRFWRLDSSRSRHRQILGLVRVPFLVHRGPCAFTGWRGEGSGWGLYSKGTYPVSYTRMMAAPAKVPPANTIILGIRIERGHKHSVYCRNQRIIWTVPFWRLVSQGHILKACGFSRAPVLVPPMQTFLGLVVPNREPESACS